LNNNIDKRVTAKMSRLSKQSEKAGNILNETTLTKD
jgi:hypothetical protein